MPARVASTDDMVLSMFETCVLWVGMRFGRLSPPSGNKKLFRTHVLYYDGGEADWPEKIVLVATCVINKSLPGIPLSFVAYR